MQYNCYTFTKLSKKFFNVCCLYFVCTLYSDAASFVRCYLLPELKRMVYFESANLYNFMPIFLQISFIEQD